MTWVKITDNFADDPRWEDGGAEGIGLLIAAMCWSSRNLTDGAISRKRLVLLAATLDIAEPGNVIEKLAALDFLTDEGAAFQITDYLVDQPSAEKVRNDRAATAKRQAEYKARRAENRAAGILPPGHAPANASVTPLLTAPRPGPSRPDPKGGREQGLRTEHSAGAPSRPPSDRGNATYIAQDDE